MTIADPQIGAQDGALFERVRQVLALTLQLEDDEVTDELSQATCPRWTSLYHMTLLVALEEEFGVTFSMDEMTAMTSLPAILTVLNSHGLRG